MNKIKCECGHVNPEGTVLCEACGKPVEKNQHIDGNEKNKLLNMRYDGSARRSQTYNKTIVDKTWNFFSSVKVGVWLIVLALVASAIGTIFPQEMYIPRSVDPSQYYRDEYGIFGQLYYELGFHNLYGSWWYILLIALIGVSLVICSIDRVVPLHRALKNQRPKRHEVFIQRQRLFGKTEKVSKDDIKTFIEQLRKKNYKISEDQGHVLAEKNRFSRWGPYVNHIGLIIILIGAILRFFPFMYVDKFVFVREGETKVIPGTNQQYYIENKDFILELYDPEEEEKFAEAIVQEGGMVPKNFQTNAVIYQVKGEVVPGAEPELEKMKEGEIRVNEPLKFNGYALYQSQYQLNEFKSMSFKLHPADNPDDAIGTFTFDMTDPKKEYDLGNGYRVVVDQYFPELKLENGVPSSESNYPRNPAFIFFVYGPDIEERETSFLAIGANIDPGEDNRYKLSLDGVEMRDVTGLAVQKDRTLPIFAAGAIIFMIGVVQGMYWQHRRIWIHPKEQGVWIAAHTNKNWHGLKRDIKSALDQTSINPPEDQQELS